MLTTPEVIRTLQRKLYTKAKQEPAYRFYALYDKVWRADILSHAYRLGLVLANKGRPSVDLTITPRKPALQGPFQSLWCRRWANCVAKNLD